MLSGCGISKPPKENEIEESIPDDILCYSLDGIQYIMEVQTIAIERRQTNGKEDFVYVVIDMEDDYVHRTAYYKFNYNYYDVGGWILDDWEKYQDTNAYPVSAPSNDIIYSKINEFYSNFEFITTVQDTLNEGSCIFTFNVNDVYPNATYTGEVDLKCVFTSTLNEDDYEWCYYIQDNNLSEKWNILGTYKANMGKYHLTLNITDISDLTINANGSYGYTDSIYEEWRNMPFDTSYKCSFSDINGITYLSFKIDDYWKVYFSKNDASAQHANYPWVELNHVSDIDEVTDSSDDYFTFSAFGESIYYKQDSFVINGNSGCWKGADWEISNLWPNKYISVWLVFEYDEKGNPLTKKHYFLLDTNEQALELAEYYAKKDKDVITEIDGNCVLCQYSSDSEKVSKMLNLHDQIESYKDYHFEVIYVESTLSEEQKLENNISILTEEDKIGTIVAPSSVKIRKNASSASEMIAAVEDGTKCKILGEIAESNEGKWYRISFLSNEQEITGYIRCEFVSVKDNTYE